MKCLLKHRAYAASPVEGVLQLENPSKYVVENTFSKNAIFSKISQ